MELNVTILYFASYKDQTGTQQEILDVPTGSDLGTIIGIVCENHKNIIACQNNIVAAVNEEYQDHKYKISDGDIIALIPPVSGGR